MNKQYIWSDDPPHMEDEYKLLKEIMDGLSEVVNDYLADLPYEEKMLFGKHQLWALRNLEID